MVTVFDHDVGVPSRSNCIEDWTRFKYICSKDDGKAARVWVLQIANDGLKVVLHVQKVHGGYCTLGSQILQHPLLNPGI